MRTSHVAAPYPALFRRASLIAFHAGTNRAAPPGGAAGIYSQTGRAVMPHRMNHRAKP